MKENFKSYLQFIAVFVLCGLANFFAHSHIANGSVDLGNDIENAYLSSYSSSEQQKDYPSYTTHSENDNQNLVFEIVDPQEIEEFEHHLNDNLGVNIGCISNFSRIQYLENFSYLIKERLCRYRYNSSKPSSDLLDRLQVYLI
ncbi:MAG: hypothetical protein KDD05_05825 [Psychroserpens sp.]|nr:hypothetical protein [Psychroserpens sp.]